MIRSLLVLLSCNLHFVFGNEDPTCVVRNNGATPDAQTDLGREDCSEEGSFIQTRASRQDKEKPPGGCGPDCPCDMGVCYFYGDPHFYTFDGGHTNLYDRNGFQTMPMNYWVVYSKSVRIQGMAASRGQTVALAIGGEFVDNHTIILSKQGMTVDGNPILSEPGEYVGPDGLFEIFRHSQLVWPREELVKEFDGKGKMFKTMHTIYGWFNKGEINYHIKLPYGQEMWISGNVKCFQVVLKARPGRYQGGYCGNFNGHVEDDQEPLPPWGNKNIGTKLDPIPADEDMFQKAGITLSSSMLQSDINNSLQSDINNGERECPAELKAKAEKACESIPEEEIKQACIMDICLTGDTSYANDAMSMEVMNMEFARGSVELEGQGHCLDSSGVKYTTVTANRISTKTECIKLLHELAHHEGIVDKGVRGAQFKDSCDILIDATEKNDLELQEAISFTVVGLKTDAGSGVVSKTDKVEGVTCWKIMI